MASLCAVGVCTVVGLVRAWGKGLGLGLGLGLLTLALALATLTLALALPPNPDSHQGVCSVVRLVALPIQARAVGRVGMRSCVLGAPRLRLLLHPPQPALRLLLGTEEQLL